MNISVQKLTSELASQFFHFFDDVAFTDNPKWASCYCYFYSHTWAEGEWSERTGDDNRRDCQKWIDREGLSGYLAFLNGQPVGWCHANDKAHIALPFLPADLAQPDPAQRTAAIVCFIVAPSFRRQGIATQILQAACAQLKQEGFHHLEAYPRREDGSVQEHYHGHPDMYYANGFARTHELDGFDLLRKTL